MNTVAVVDYGMGNLQSVAQAMRYVAAQVSGAQVLITADPEQVRGADRVLLPGQGALPDCMQELRHSGLLQAVLEAAASKPLFGICVGMQMLFQNSQESLAAQPTPGLGVFDGKVLRFQLEGLRQADGTRYKVPQMGWNQVFQTHPHPLWGGVPDGSYYYFAHSFFAEPSDARHNAGESEYGIRFTSAVCRDNIFATQFHPEKSADCGLALYRNFLSWNP